METSETGDLELVACFTVTPPVVLLVGGSRSLKSQHVDSIGRHTFSHLVVHRQFRNKKILQSDHTAK